MENYPYLEKFSSETGIKSENLIKCFEIESQFHHAILNEDDFEKRQWLYSSLYNEVHNLLKVEKTNKQRIDKTRIVKLFKRELEGHSILDIGCGSGVFLEIVDEYLNHERLTGIDVSVEMLPECNRNIEFIEKNIIKFEMNTKYDVVISDNVLEHIAPSDLNEHITSIKKVLKNGGMLIILMPNRLFGPSDITRIVDYTHSNKIQAMGSHLFESTYSEIIELLKKHGFNNFKSILPIPKIKNILKNIRIDAKYYSFLENNDYFLKILYKIKIKEISIGKNLMSVTVIARMD